MKRDDPVKMELILDGIQKKFGEKEVLLGVSFIIILNSIFLRK